MRETERSECVWRQRGSDREEGVCDVCERHREGRARRAYCTLLEVPVKGDTTLASESLSLATVVCVQRLCVQRGFICVCAACVVCACVVWCACVCVCV